MKKTTSGIKYIRNYDYEKNSKKLASAKKGSRTIAPTLKLTLTQTLTLTGSNFPRGQLSGDRNKRELK